MLATFSQVGAEEILKTENTLGPTNSHWLAFDTASTPALSLAMFSHYFIHTFLAAFLAKSKSLGLAQKGAA